MKSGVVRWPRVAGMIVGAAGVLCLLGGCNTGGGLPQQLEFTKPHIDKTVETDHPAPTAGNAEAPAAR